MANILDKYTNDELMAMKKPQLIEVAREIGKLNELLALFDMKVEKKRHSKKRVLKPSKNPKLNGKLTWQVDDTEETTTVIEDAGFFEIKAKFIHEVCGLPYTEKEKELSFKEMVLAAIAEEEAKKASAAEELAAEQDEINKKLGFKK